MPKWQPSLRRRGAASASRHRFVIRAGRCRVECDERIRERRLVVEQRFPARDQLALRIEHIEQRGEPFAVQGVGLAERGLALLDRLG